MVISLQAYMNPNENSNKRAKHRYEESREELSQGAFSQFPQHPMYSNEQYQYPTGITYPCTLMPAALSYSPHFTQSGGLDTPSMMASSHFNFNNSETPIRPVLDGVHLDHKTNLPNQHWSAPASQVRNMEQPAVRGSNTGNNKREIESLHVNKKSDTSSRSKICALCSKELESEEGISFKDLVYHEFCFYCSECYLPLANTNYYLKGGSIRCQEHANDSSQSRTFKAFMSIQPETYQIANYNIYPSPQITFNRELDRESSISVALIENETHSVVSQGFRNAEINRELSVGVQAKTFTGLKLSKKSVIKSYLKQLNLKKPNQVTFCIKFTLNNVTWYSRSFKILSSCSQLPPHLRDTIRPFAVNNNVGSTSPPPVTPSSSSLKLRSSPKEPPSITESEYLHSILPPPNDSPPPSIIGGGQSG